MITDTANSDNSPNAKRCRSNLKILFTAQFLEMGTLEHTTYLYCENTNPVGASLLAIAVCQSA
jgi:hypothetical protein